ncbi:MAG: LLM class flavin-dependent oxidoreductase [Rhodospirillaceae bacterium]|nr:LLM class flavin-dependent oxidoreductase [Rhodospirillaceae bacterium]
MQIDIFLEFASPPGPRDLASVFEDNIAIARAADAAGFGAVWIAEHHFLGDYSNASAPDMLLSAIARETERIGLGFAIVPLPITDPVRVAERLATLDLLSGGRPMWGAGRGGTVTELEGFGVDPSDSRPLFRGRFDELRTLLSTGRTVRGEKPYEIRPRPGPHLAAGWLAAVSPESFELAAELELDVMTGPFKPWPMVKSDLNRYRKMRPGGRSSFTLAVHCEEDHKSARHRAEPGLLWVYRKIFEVTRPLLSRQIAGYEHYRKLGWVTPLLDKVLSLTVLEAMGLAAVGDPAHILKRLQALQASGLDRVSLVLGGGDLSRQEVVACIELLRDRVLPLLEKEAVVA